MTGLRAALNHSSALHLVAVSLLCVACMDADKMSEQIGRENEFAQQFIRDLHAGGLPKVRDRIKPATLQGVRDPDTEFAVMLKNLPAGEIDSVRLVSGNIEQARRMTISKLGYRVYGERQTAQVDLWIETSAQGRVVETLRVSGMDGEAAPRTQTP